MFTRDTHNKKFNEAWKKKKWGGELLYREHTANSAGQVDLFREGLSCNITVEHESQRSFVVKVDLGGKQLAIVNICAPNATKDKLLFFNFLLLTSLFR